MHFIRSSGTSASFVWANHIVESTSPRFRHQVRTAEEGEAQAWARNAQLQTQLSAAARKLAALHVDNRRIQVCAACGPRLVAQNAGISEA